MSGRRVSLHPLSLLLSHLLLNLQCPGLGKGWLPVPGGKKRGSQQSQEAWLWGWLAGAGLAHPWEPINRKQTLTLHLLLVPPPTVLPLVQDLPHSSQIPEISGLQDACSKQQQPQNHKQNRDTKV